MKLNWLRGAMLALAAMIVAGTSYAADAYKSVSLTAATYTLDARHHGAVLTADRAAGITITLPDATGSGRTFEIVVTTTITSNNLVIQVPDADNTMTGVAVMATAAASDNVIAFETASTSDTITMNGTTKGGILGDRIVLKDIGANKWAVSIFCSGTGVTVTMFSAAVS